MAGFVNSTICILWQSFRDKPLRPLNIGRNVSLEINKYKTDNKEKLLAISIAYSVSQSQLSDLFHCKKLSLLLFLTSMRRQNFIRIL